MVGDWGTGGRAPLDGDRVPELGKKGKRAAELGTTAHLQGVRAGRFALHVPALSSVLSALCSLRYKRDWS